MDLRFSLSIFLAATLLITSVVSLVTCPLCTTCSDISLIGVCTSFDILISMIGRVVISCLYFCDKTSPLPDITNLASAIAGSKLFDYIKHKFYTTVPSYLICSIQFLKYY